MFGAEQGQGEVRLVPVSETQRDMIARLLASAGWLDHDFLAAWDAAVPGVVDARWAEVARDLATALRLTQEYVGDKVLPNLPGWSHFDARKRYEIARAAAGGERPSVSLRETDCKTCGCKYLALEQQSRAYWTDEAKAAESRLERISELLEQSDLVEDYVESSRLFTEAWRLARGEEASDG